jgi:hypothetical protein
MEIINNALDHHSSKNESDLIQIKINPSAEGKGLTIGINISNDGPVAYQALRNKAEEFANRGLLLKKNSENNDKNADEYVVSYGTKAGYYSIGRNEVAFIGDIELVFIYGLSAGKKENSIGGNGVGLKLSRRLMRSMGS